MSASACHEENMKKRQESYHQKKAKPSERDEEWRKKKQQSSHKKGERRISIKQREQNDVEDGRKTCPLKGSSEGRATLRGVARKAPPQRWRKRDFAIRLKRTRPPKVYKLLTTFVSLPKFSEPHGQQKVKVASNAVEAAAAVQEVRRHVTALVLAEQGLADVVLDGYNGFLDELTSKGSLFLHEFENEFGKHVLKLEDVERCSVQQSPLMCRQDEASYLLPLTVLASYTCVDAQGSQMRAFSLRVSLGDMPLMVGSKACPTRGMKDEDLMGAGQQPGEPGGYFILDGVEKFIPFRNVHKKNNPLVLKCSGQEGHKFSFKCSVFSSVSGTESYHTVVLVSTKQSLVVKLSFGRGVKALVPLNIVLAASGVQGHLEPPQDTQSHAYLQRTLSAILMIKEQQQEKGKGKGGDAESKAVVTRNTFKARNGGKSSVAETVLDYLVAASRMGGVTEQDLHRMHRKCEKSDGHHATLLKIAEKFAEMVQEETRQEQEYKRDLTVLQDVMLQGCEDVAVAVHMVTAALTLPSEKEALKAIKSATKGMLKAACVSEVLERALVPHAGGGLPQRAFYVAYMTNQVLQVLCERRAADDPLHLGNRMLMTPGTFVKNLFNSVMKSILQQARDTIEQKYKMPRPKLPDELDLDNFYEDDECILGEKHSRLLKKNEKMLSEKIDICNIFQFHHNFLYERMCLAFRTGIWGKAASAMKGVTQNLQRLNYLQYLSQVRTVNGEDKVLDGLGSVPHELHTSIVGFLCLMETPENEYVGLTEHLALGTTVCRLLEPAHVHQVLQTLPVKVFAEDECPAPDQLGKVFVDGRWVGNAEAPVWRIKERLVEYRRSHTLHLGVHLRNHDLHVDTSGGRPVRPLLAVQGGALTLTPDDLPALRERRLLLDDLWKKGIVDFLDPLENSEAFIAETPADLCQEGVNYCQLQALLNHGIVSATIPVGSANPGVRRLGSCKVQKQAMGRPVVSELLAHRGTYSVLKTSEIPLALPQFILHLPNSRFMYSGQSALTAVMAVRGLNQEDGLVFSQGAIDRGLLTSLHFHSYRKYDSRLGADVTNCAAVGQRLQAGDVVITCKDERRHVRVREIDGPSEVTRSLVKFVRDGRVLYEVETVQERKPEVGDKFATLNGQKGVICGILPDCELPKLEDGRTPDVFISPHSFLDRQTVGFFVEGMLNTLAAHVGFLLDATSIDSGWDLLQARKALRVQGLSSAVKVLSPSGREMGHIFCAPIFYMRLKHLAVLKCHARHDGPVDPVFRQPMEGLALGGGLRLGEMEVAALVSHGAAELVQELMHDQSDGLQLPYCNTCLKWAAMVGEHVSCRQCRRIENLVMRRTTYGFKFFEECLMMMNLKLLQYGQGHEYSECDMEYENSDLSSLSSDEEHELESEERLENAVETIVKRSLGTALKLPKENTRASKDSHGCEVASASSWKSYKPS